MSRTQPPSPVDPAFRIELPTFEGPLDLLLHLIKQHELDILDLPIAFVSQRYLEYIDVMKELDLDVASEYLVMAAELARIKSKLLLPPSPDDDDDVDEDELDPRAELIRRLLEYQKYKKVAAELAARDLRGRDIFVREVPPPKSMEPAPLREFSIFKLLEAFHKVLERTSRDAPFEISAERITIQARMSQITEALRARRHCSFFSLFEEARATYDVVVTFLAVLEMTKMRITRLYQSEHNAEIYLEYRVFDDDSDLDTHDAPAPEAAPDLDPEAAPDPDPTSD